jgi:excisionase family DNA binding protein
MEKRFLNPRELGEYLVVKQNTIYSWVSQRKIPFKKFGRLVRFSIEEIDEWVKDNSVEIYSKH